MVFIQPFLNQNNLSSTIEFPLLVPAPRTAWEKVFSRVFLLHLYRNIINSPPIYPSAVNFTLGRKKGIFYGGNARIFSPELTTFISPKTKALADRITAKLVFCAE